MRPKEHFSKWKEHFTVFDQHERKSTIQKKDLIWLTDYYAVVPSIIQKIN